MFKNTKIVATLGPSSDDYTTIKKMVQAGMNVARLNFSHGTHEHHTHLLKTVRKVSQDLDTPIAVLQDLQGPKIRVGELKEPVKVKKGQKLILTSKKNTKDIPLQYKSLPAEVKKDTTIFINDGLIELKVLKTNRKDRIECKVIAGGEITSRRGINVIDGCLKSATLTAKDKRDLAWGIKNKVDYIALSFVKDSTDILSLKRRLKGTKIKVIAKIERREAVEDETLEKIIEASDAIMVARGDLGVEVRPEYVPILQKRMIHLANLHAKPVITATQMLQSMTNNPAPTRAEVSDVANAILDHTDAVMLSNETSTGPYPIKAVRIMKRVATATEEEMKLHKVLAPKSTKNMLVPRANAYAGVRLAFNSDAKTIVVLTKSGNSALEVAKYRPLKYNVVFTGSEKTKNQLALVWGVNKAFCTKNFASMKTSEIIKILRKFRLTEKGREIVIIDSRKKFPKIETVKL